MLRSNFVYQVDEDFIKIADLNGSMSVTNDIENVLKHIEENEKIDLSNYNIAHCDSSGQFDLVKINSFGKISWEIYGATDFGQLKKLMLSK